MTLDLSDLDETTRNLLLAAQMVDDLDAASRREEDAFALGFKLGYGHGYDVGWVHGVRSQAAAQWHWVDRAPADYLREHAGIPIGESRAAWCAMVQDAADVTDRESRRQWEQGQQAEEESAS